MIALKLDGSDKSKKKQSKILENISDMVPLPRTRAKNDPPFTFSSCSLVSSTCFLLQDGRVSNCSPYHVISIQSLSLIFMDDPQFDQHALSLYRFYSGILSYVQLWTSENNSKNFKISHPPTKLFPNGISPFPRKTRRAPK